LEQDYKPTVGAVDKLIQEFNKLPGIGPKSAQRIVYYLLRASDEQARLLAEALLSLKQEIKLCSVCFNVTDSDPCRIVVTTSAIGVRFALWSSHRISWLWNIPEHTMGCTTCSTELFHPPRGWGLVMSASTNSWSGCRMAW